MSIPGPFKWKSTLSLTATPFSPAMLTRLRGTTIDFDAMGVALVDISGSSSACLASKWTKTGYAASLVKIAAMYAAYYLQQHVRAAAAAMPATSFRSLHQALRKQWKSQMKAKIPKSVGDFPQIEKIFTRTFDFHPSFKRDMKWMIKESKNSAAGRCIHRIGYDYLNGALVHGGFYAPGRQSGLWLAGDYLPTHIEKGGKKIRNPRNRDGVRAPGLGTSQAASAEAVTKMLVSLARNHLISAAASQDMKAVMSDSYSWIRYHMERQHPNAKVYGKLGLLKKDGPDLTDDCAIVKHGSAEYVVTTLFGKGDLTLLHEELDRIAMSMFSFRKAVNQVQSLGKQLVHRLRFR